MSNRIIDIMVSAAQVIAQAAVQFTIPLTLISFSIGLVIAFVTAMIQVANIKVLKQITSAYVAAFRCTPLMVQLFIVYFGLPKIGITLDAFPSGIIAFSLNVGAYSSETIRAAILSIPKGQWEAGTALSMGYFTLLRRIIFPQAMKVAVPPLFNSFIDVVKNTSLASTITLPEMMMVTENAVATSFEPFWLYCLVALFYFALCYALSRLQKYIERKLYVA